MIAWRPLERKGGGGERDGQSGIFDIMCMRWLSRSVKAMCVTVPC